MSFYQLIVQLIDLRSFSNLWYWIMLGVMWSAISHRSLGIPSDLIRHAQFDAAAAADLRAMARITAQRYVNLSAQTAAWVAGGVFFTLSALLTAAIWFGSEFALATFWLLGPACPMLLVNLSTARRILAATDDAGLQRTLGRHRGFVYLLGFGAIFITAGVGMWMNLRIGAFG
ncbi:MAG: component of SufBCD complex [Rhodobacteraceae bacterium]|nr:component of SufBCD complex [Paracoccaceae bacterium]